MCIKLNQTNEKGGLKGIKMRKKGSVGLSHAVRFTLIDTQGGSSTAAQSQCLSSPDSRKASLIKLRLKG